MFRIFKNKIFLTRGDSAIFTLTITDANGDEYTPAEGDEITFTVKANTETRDILIQKDASSGKIEIQPEDNPPGIQIESVVFYQLSGRVMFL